MRTRLLLGSTMIVVIAGLFSLDYSLGSRSAISALIVILGLGAYFELARMGGIRSTERGGSLPLFLVGLASSAYFLAAPWLELAVAPGGAWVLPLGVLGLLLGSFASIVFRKDYARGFPPLLFSVTSVLLFGFLYSSLLRIYQAQDGLLRGVVFILGVKGNDIVAYFVGRAVGRHRFLTVSPNKTLEGCLAAVVFSLLWFPGMAYLWPEKFFPWPHAIPLAIILSFATQVGDLAESLMKRCYQVKDSSSLIPEFGGILDLMDSVLFSGFIFWIVGPATQVPWR